MRNGPVQPDPRTKNEDARLGRQGARRNGYQIMDNTLDPEAEKNFIAYRHRWEPPEPKTRRRTCGTGR